MKLPFFKKILLSQHFPKSNVCAQGFILLVNSTLSQVLVSLSAISGRDLHSGFPGVLALKNFLLPLL